MKKLLIVTLLALILGACTAQTEKIVETVAPEKIIETVVLEVTPTPEIVYEANSEQADKYTDRMFNKGSDCEMIMRGLGLTVPATNLDNLPLVTDPRYKLIKFAGCVNELAEYEVPEYCDECTDLDAKVQEYVKLNLEAVELIMKGHRIPSLAILSDGLVARWDAVELWDEIRLDVVAVREVYDLEPLW